MKELPSIQALIDSFSKLPGVGVKSAERMAYAVLNFKDEDREEFSRALHNLGERVHPCPECGMYTENEGKCDICLDATRNHQLVCVVSEVKDIERSGKKMDVILENEMRLPIYDIEEKRNM